MNLYNNILAGIAYLLLPIRQSEQKIRLLSEAPRLELPMDIPWESDDSASAAKMFAEAILGIVPEWSGEITTTWHHGHKLNFVPPYTGECHTVVLRNKQRELWIYGVVGLDAAGRRHFWKLESLDVKPIQRTLNIWNRLSIGERHSLEFRPSIGFFENGVPLVQIFAAIDTDRRVSKSCWQTKARPMLFLSSKYWEIDSVVPLEWFLPEESR